MQGRLGSVLTQPLVVAALYVDGQTNRVGVNTETPGVTLDVNGNVNFTGNAVLGGTLDVTGNVAIGGTLDVTGNIGFSGTAVVDGRVQALGYTSPGAPGTINGTNFGTRIGLTNGGVAAAGLFTTSRDVGAGTEVGVFWGNAGASRFFGDGSATFTATATANLLVVDTQNTADTPVLRFNNSPIADRFSSITVTPTDGNGNSMGFLTNPNGGAGVERLRISHTGRIAFGSAVDTFPDISPTGGSTGTARFNFQAGTDFDTSLLLFERVQNGTASGYLVLGSARGTLPTRNIIANGDALGSLIFAGWDGEKYASSATIKGQMQGTPAVGQMGGQLQFLVAADGTDAQTQRLTIYNTGAMRHAMGFNNTYQSFVGSVTDNGASGTATFDIVFTFGGNTQFGIIEILGYHPNYTGQTEFYKVVFSRRQNSNLTVAAVVDDLTGTGSIQAQGNRTFTFRGRRPRSTTGTSIDSRIRVYAQANVEFSSVTIADS